MCDLDRVVFGDAFRGEKNSLLAHARPAAQTCGLVSV